MDIESWNLVLTTIGTLAVIIASILGIPQLIQISRSGRLDSTLALFEKVRKASELWETIYKRLPTDSKTASSLSPKLRAQIMEVINLLNEICVLLDDKLIDKIALFGLCHTMIIRCWYTLKPFAEYEEMRIGGRYARGLESLDRRAKLFHDISKKHRITIVKILIDKKEVVIYQTPDKRGLAGLIQRIVWRLRRTLKWF